MRVELRKSGGEPCEECGAQELITTVAYGERLETDVWEIFEPQLEKAWRDLVSLVADPGVLLEEKEPNGVIEVARTDPDVEAIREGIMRGQEEYERMVEELFAEKVPRYRVLKKKWMSEMREEILARTRELALKTAKV